MKNKNKLYLTYLSKRLNISYDKRKTYSHLTKSNNHRGYSKREYFEIRETSDSNMLKGYCRAVLNDSDYKWVVEKSQDMQFQSKVNYLSFWGIVWAFIILAVVSSF